MEYTSAEEVKPDKPIVWGKEKMICYSLPLQASTMAPWINMRRSPRQVPTTIIADEGVAPRPHAIHDGGGLPNLVTLCLMA